jgi:hypothetical protein
MPVKGSLESPESFSQLLLKHGWKVSANELNIEDIKNKFNYESISSLIHSLEQLIRAGSANTSHYIDVLKQLAKVVTDIRDFSANPPTMNFLPFNDPNFWKEFPDSLVDGLFFDYVESSRPTLFLLLRLVGILDSRSVDPGDAPSRVPYVRKIVKWDHIKNIIRPANLIKESYGLDSSGFNLSSFFNQLSQLGKDLGIDTSLRIPDQELLNRYYNQSNNLESAIVNEFIIPIAKLDNAEDGKVDASLSALPIPKNDGSGPPIGAALIPSLVGIPPEINFGNLVLRLEGDLNPGNKIFLEIRPTGITTGSNTSNSEIHAKASLDYTPAQPLNLIGSERSNHLQVSDVKTSLEISGQVHDPEVKFDIAVNKAEIIINNTEGDSFIQEIAGSSTSSLEFPIQLSLSSKTGLTLNGRPSLESIVATDKNLNILHIKSLAISLRSGDSLEIAFGASGTAIFGPVAISVDGLGLRAMVEFIPRGNPPGNFGPLNLSFAFKPPDGLGIAINSQGVRGGGFIWRREDQYAGVLDLDLRGFAVQAIAVIDTTEVSFICAVFASFEPEIQIGGGFKITKIGGSIGLNRTVSFRDIATGIQSGILDSILFPENVIQNASRIINDFKRVFPAQNEQYLMGPAVKIAFGTPTLITGDIAILLEFPRPFQLAVVGKISCKIPEDQTIIRINLGILGAIDFTGKKVGIYGTLYNSKILDFDLSGDMAMAASWGSEKNFIFSIGGFHPRFTPPSNFPPFGAPPLRRLRLSLASDINMECYLALTSNTFQIGARVDARFSKARVEISGYWGFDALIQFSPLYYIIEIAAGFAVKYRGKSICSISFYGSLEGPNPHRIKGKAKVSILFLDVSIEVDHRFGAEKPAVKELVDPWTLLEPALKQNENWSADFPEWADIGVTISESSKEEAKENLIVHPAGTLRVSQRIVPLNYRLTKFGAADPDKNYKFEILVPEESASSMTLQTIEEYFAPAQFTNLSNAQRLSSKSYELMASGVAINFSRERDFPVASSFSSKATKKIEYETEYDRVEVVPPPSCPAGHHFDPSINACVPDSIPEPPPPPKPDPKHFEPTFDQKEIFEHTSIARKVVLQNKKNLAYHHKLKNDSQFVLVSDDKYQIVDTSRGDFQIMSDDNLAGQTYSQAVAVNKLNELRKSDPANKGSNKRVMALFELELVR